ncbi:hypothetical protein ABGB19_01405 [Mycobacterium sp. B14F4]|uniref:hypothetical protein n=1 Tax=Mycobacterium sp. B14F4 TaxID=3153565 RepID=UPI00325DC7A1
MKTLTTLLRRPAPVAATYEIRELLHEGRTARVSAEAIANTVSAWLSDLGAVSPSVHELARTMRSGDWPAAYAIAESLSLEVSVTTPAFRGA